MVVSMRLVSQKNSMVVAAKLRNSGGKSSWVMISRVDANPLKGTVHCFNGWRSGATGLKYCLAWAYLFPTLYVDPRIRDSPQYRPIPCRRGSRICGKGGGAPRAPQARSLARGSASSLIRGGGAPPPWIRACHACRMSRLISLHEPSRRILLDYGLVLIDQTTFHVHHMKYTPFVI